MTAADTMGLMADDMDKTIEQEEQIFARVIYGALSGRQPSGRELTISRRYWHRQCVSPWQDPDDPNTAHYTQLAFNAMLEVGRNTSLSERWRNQFDHEGCTLPGRAGEFLSDYLQTLIHFRRHYHRFSCHRQRIHDGHIMDFPIEHPVAIDYWTIYITNSGRGVLRLGSNESTIEARDVLIMPPGQKATIMRAPDSVYWDYDRLSFRSMPVWLELLDWSFSLASPAPLHINDRDQWRLIHEVVDQLEHTTYSSGHYTERLCHNLIENLLIRLRINRERAGDSVQMDERLAVVVNHLLMHYRVQEQLSDIARLARLSPGRLNALFRKHFGTSVMKWRDALRLQKARELLLFTELPINEIAEQVGYDDPLYFSRRFKQQFNQPPRSIRTYPVG